jgi:hypothetical protein
MDSLDDFPTPAWATRGLLEHPRGSRIISKSHRCLEPACGAGHMSKVLGEYFEEVQSFDAHDYGYGGVRNFLTYPYEDESFDLVVTNPPFRLAEQFILRALPIARVGVAVLVRTVFVEGVGRHERLFRPHPMWLMLQFSERVPMVKGRLDRQVTTATAYAWLVWLKDRQNADPVLAWISRCRKQLERDGDYPVQPGSS